MEDSPAMKSDLSALRTELKSDIAELRSATKSDIAELRSATKSDIAELRSATKSDIAELRSATKSDIAELRIEMIERMEKTETTLLREFRKWAIRFETPIRANQVLVSGFDERLATLEERVNDLEQK